MTVVGIIGGTGKLGGLFRKIFEEEGFEVLVSSRTTSLSKEELIRKSDIIIVSVPIKSTIPVIREITPFIKEGKLLMDLTSLKVGPINEMLKSKADVLGAHPLFAPSIGDVRGQTIILCPQRISNKELYQKVNFILTNRGANIVEMTPEEHDKMMAVIQGLTHFSAIALCHCMKDLNFDIKKSFECTSPVYRLTLDMAGRILNQEPELYADISLLNPITPEILLQYIKSAETLFNKIQTKDREGFIKFFEEASQYLGDFTEKAEKESNLLIKKMVSE
ncbi:MAG: prephenate dehydrogenase [Euryarchaeota archaeon ADurb.Bin023]|nr:prephenate dehydrogenase/arogenate dehydrogenase family protein [Methanofastidiosum sp.]OQC51987.1 MAG: prephenate dehydrogenase [Euryarchaeota archaeon ADurb.Bin023]HOE92955.1 prephenate dehydrogenase/arogenate dehydrogenase family protein [Methanofastidiosum sp.]HOR87379.1 prephenate dehydrogenase/arogenate dehydrogenase family protein [Methanofastidiosum sp.]HOT84317.1 prephenate dehydrogenase/arogenate dehydrogenase family protein [Methanofastidiosum sp.]